MHLIIPIVVILALVFGPGLWVKHVLRKYGRPEDRYPGTGAEFAKHLLLNLGLDHVKVEESPVGDHYDPDAKAVRLAPERFNSRSLAAVTVAAHEVGHAVQDYDGYSAFRARTFLARSAVFGERLGRILLIGAPIVTLLTRAPAAGGLMLLGVLLSVGLATIVHLVTLPVELDASFKRALPMLEKGNYLHDTDMPHARKLLKAAALTYVASSMFSVLNVLRWLRFPR